MAGFEYKVVPAPGKGVKAKGVKTPEDRFAYGLQELMNTLGADGWQYLRADTLPSTERSGLTGSQTIWRHVLVFQRPLSGETRERAEPPVRASQTQEIAPEPAPAPTPAPEPEAPVHEDPDRPAGQPGATRMLKDNGVEETSEVAGRSMSLTALAASRKSSDGSDT